MPKPFSELVVVEIAGSIAGAYACKLFADFGAAVIKVEPPGGDPRRNAGEPLAGMGSEFAYLNTGKTSAIIDLETPSGRAQLEEFVASADVVVESASPGPLVPVTRGFHQPHLIRVLISPFGLEGPYAGFRSNDFTDFAAGGQMYLTGELDREPIRSAGPQCEYAAGIHAFTGAMAALRDRDRTGLAQTVEVTHMETMVSLHQWTSVRWTHGGVVQRRVGNRYDTLHPVTIYPCKDGHVGISASSEDQTERFMAMAGVGEWHDDDRFRIGQARLENADAFDDLVLPWLMERTSAEIVEILQEVRVPVAPVPTMLELLDDPHLAARNFWTELPRGDDSGRSLLYPGPPFRMSRHPWSLQPAPSLSNAAVQPPEADPELTRPALGPRPSALPLAGVVVLDLSRVWAGPLGTRILADLGADVIKVEPTWGRPRRVSDQTVRVTNRFPGNVAGDRPWNREGMYNKFNRNKRAITLNLDRPEGKAALERLVAKADVVIENYSPRVMPQLGLGYERLAELNPAIIYIGMPGYGWDGPYRDRVAYGTTLEPHSGLSSAMGYRDSGPYKSGVAWADPVAAMHASAAVVMALYDRASDPDGRGQAIELAQFDGMIALAGDQIVAAQVRGANPARTGNRDRQRVPQGAFPCAGDDRWIAISIDSDEAWRAFAALAELPSEFAALGFESRAAREDELEALIASWTAGFDHISLMYRLQQQGIVAVALLDARELVENEHLRSRGFWWATDHPDCGTLDFPGLPIHLSRTPARVRMPAPGLGQHNREVFRDLGGMSEAEIDGLYAAGVAADEPPA